MGQADPGAEGSTGLNRADLGTCAPKERAGMIGGYIYGERDAGVEAGLRNRLGAASRFVDFPGSGFFFYTEPLPAVGTAQASSGGLTVLSEDLLAFKAGDGSYRHADLVSDFLAAFDRRGPEAFDSIHSDFRMAVISARGPERELYLASNRAGSGRIYYYRLKTGIVFCSDLRFLLKVAPLEVSRMAVYALLKYGSIPEPLTIAENVSAVPAAHYFRYRLADGRGWTAPYFRYRFPADRSREPFEEKKSLGRVRETLRRTAKFLGGYPSAMLLSGGIDSSLYGCYLDQEKTRPFRGFYCSFGQDDPEQRFARAVAERLGVELEVATMSRDDAMRALDDAVRLADHPFSDFSSLPIVFLLRFIKEHSGGEALVIECNGGDDCFGFPALTQEGKYRLKHAVPGILKRGIARLLARSSCWKWESSEGFLARIASLADAHERSALNYFLLQAPVNYLGMMGSPDWDETLQEIIERTVSGCGEDYDGLSYEAKTTIRQLFYINSARWAAKAFSVGESLGIRVIYPFVWRDVLLEQGKLPWDVKVRDGVVKWPLKRLLEEYMPADFIYRRKSGFVPPFVRWLTDAEFNDRVRSVLLGRGACVSEIIPTRLLQELLDDTRAGKRLRSPILNTLWGAYFAESWTRERRSDRSAGSGV